MIVVDTNIIAYFFICGDKTDDARRLWHQDSDWRVPALWLHEYLNVLATYARAAGTPMEDMLQLLYTATNMLNGTQHEVDMAEALKVVTANKISAYDAQFVTLAKALDIPLVTEDRKLQATFPGIAIPTKDFLKT